MQELEIINFKNDDGCPIGGTVKGLGVDISWQNGALGRGKEKMPPNGAFVETVIYAAQKRLEFFQDSKFKCLENELAIENLKSALHFLERRTKKREKAGTEGTYVID